MRCPTSRDLLAAAASADPTAALLARCVTDAGGTAVDPASLAGPRRAAVDAAAERLAGAAAVVLRAGCPACGGEVRVDVDVAALLWQRICVEVPVVLAEVAELSAAFGWSEADVLAISRCGATRTSRLSGAGVNGFFARMGERAAGRPAPLRLRAPQRFEPALRRGPPRVTDSGGPAVDPWAPDLDVETVVDAVRAVLPEATTVATPRDRHRDLRTAAAAGQDSSSGEVADPVLRSPTSRKTLREETPQDRPHRRALAGRGREVPARRRRRGDDDLGAPRSTGRATSPRWWAASDSGWSSAATPRSSR